MIRKLIAVAITTAALGACTTTQKSEVKESVNTAEARTKQAGSAIASGAKEAWDEATDVPAPEREKRVFQTRQETRLKQLSTEVDGLKEEADIYDFDDSAAFKQAEKNYEAANKTAKDRLATVRGHKVEGWEKDKKPVEDAVRTVDESVKRMRDIVHSRAH